MTVYDEWKRLVADRAAVSDEADWIVDEICDREIALLASHPRDTVRLIATRFDEEDALWLCEILEDLVDRTGEAQLVEGTRRLLAKYPDVAERYLLLNYVEGAERLLDYLESAGGPGGGAEHGEGDNGAQREEVR